MSARAGGFSLLELMITVAIVAILASVAYPSYTDYVRRGNRAAAQAVLQDLGQRQQQYFSQRRTFAASLGDLNYTVPADVSSKYTVTAAAAAGTPPTFTLTATPKAGTIQASDPTLTLDSTGAKSPANAW